MLHVTITTVTMAVIVDCSIFWDLINNSRFCSLDINFVYQTLKDEKHYNTLIFNDCLKLNFITS